jgi:hypothetical protein
MPWRILAAALSSRLSYPREGLYVSEHVTIVAILCLTTICISAFTVLTILSLYDQAVPTALWSMPGACVGALAAFLARGAINVRSGNRAERAPAGPEPSGVPQQGAQQVPGSH